jgi:acyl dehydratase
MTARAADAAPRHRDATTSGPAQATPTQATPTQVTPGDTIGPRTFTVSREDVRAYADASGDHNPIHLDDNAATQVGLPGTIAHGMLTMSLASQLLVDWARDPGAVIQIDVRFGQPLPIPPAGAATLEVTGEVQSVADGVAQVTLTALHEGAKVLSRANAQVRLGGSDQHER